MLSESLLHRFLKPIALVVFATTLSSNFCRFRLASATSSDLGSRVVVVVASFILLFSLQLRAYQEVKCSKIKCGATNVYPSGSKFNHFNVKYHDKHK